MLASTYLISFAGQGGADLLNSTTRQIHLQHLLQLPTPNYQHLPVLINARGEKLSKQTLAQAVDDSQPVIQLLRGLHLLQQEPPPELINYEVGTVLEWAIKNWNKDALTEILKIRSE